MYIRCIRTPACIYVLWVCTSSVHTYIIEVFVGGLYVRCSYVCRGYMKPLPDILAYDDVMIREGSDGLFWTAVPGMHAVNYCLPSRSSSSCRLTAHMEYFGHTRGSDQSTGSCELVFFSSGSSGRELLRSIIESCCIHDPWYGALRRTSVQKHGE